MPTSIRLSASQKGFAAILIIIPIVILAITSLFLFSQKHQSPINVSPANLLPSSNKAVEAGKKLSNSYCSGEGVPYKLSVLPMKMKDFTYIEPYGAMIGGHVTPIDHQYFYPTIFRSPKDTYEVYAMAPSKIVSVEVHPTRIRLIFSVSCTFFYYYDLLTSVEPDISDKNLPITVKAGQLIGHIGGQTLDFAVWDTTTPLKGFIVPEHYNTEAWKIHTADPIDFYTDDLKFLALSKYVRTEEPRSGKIDYDIDGKIIGTWFQEGTGGYGGKSGGHEPDYFKGQLSIVPFHLDPSAFIISVGYLAPENGGSDNQFSVPRNAPNPATIGVAEGLVKYELRRWNDVKSDGSRWDNLEFTPSVRLDNENSPMEGCALVQLIEVRKLKFETFLKESCEDINGFTNNAQIYER